jgi:hypothetical protein
MAKIINLLAEQLEDKQEQLVLVQQEIEYTPHKKYSIEERAYTRVHIDRKKQDFERSNLHLTRRIKRQAKWNEVI